MVKKIFIIFILLLFFCINKVQGLSEYETITQKVSSLNKLIIDKQTGEYLQTLKFSSSKDDSAIFEIGNHKGAISAISAGKKYENKKILKIIKNGYCAENIKELNTDSANDLYIATKIAIDCVINDWNASEIDTYYQIGNNLNQDKEIRAKNIIKKAKELLDLVSDFQEKNIEEIQITKIGNFAEDDIKNGYYSQLFEIEYDDVEISNYQINSRSIRRS